jgi:hypothetical protein
MKQTNTAKVSAERQQLSVINGQVSNSILESFCSQFGIKGVDAAVQLLKTSFFHSLIEKGAIIKDSDIYNIANVANNCKLNPFNSELYPLLTPFGRIIILPTVEGWMKIGQRHEIEHCEFTYSPEKVEVNNAFGPQIVHEWIECEVRHAQRGSIRLREYVTECMNDENRHLPSWYRPNRQLRNTAMIQCYRALLPVAGLSDQEHVQDLNRLEREQSINAFDVLREGSRELQATKKVVSNNSPMETKLGINVDDIEIDEEESVEEPQNVAPDNSETSEVMQITEESEESEVMQITEEQTQSEGKASVEVTTEAEPEHEAATETATSSNVVAPVVKATSDTVDDLAQEFISASEVSPALVSTFRKMVSYMKAGDSRYTIATLEKFRDSAVKKVADKQWVTQEISKLQ